MTYLKTITVINSKDAELLNLSQRFVNETNDLIAILDSDYSYCYVNPAYASVHGMTAEKFKGQKARDFLGEKIFDSIVKPKMEKCFGGEEIRYEEWFDFPHKGVLYMEVKYIPLKNNRKEIDRIGIILHDITYTKEAEESKLKQEKFHTILEMAGTYNHNINNPLCSLQGYLELLKRDEKDPKRIDFFEKALGDIQRIADTTRKLEEITDINYIDYAGGERILDIEK